MRPLLALSCLAFATSALADARLEYRSEGSCQAFADRLDISGSRLRMDVHQDGTEYSNLVDGGEELTTVLMHEQRQYQRMEADEDAVDYTADVTGSSMKYVDRQMEQMQKQMREQCEQYKGKKGMEQMAAMCGQMPDMKSMLAAAMPEQARWEILDSGRQEEIRGATCEWVEWRQGGRLLKEECSLDLAALPLPEADRRGAAYAVRVLQRYGKAFAPLRERFASAGERDAGPSFRIPVEVRCYGENGQRQGAAMLDIRTETIDPARFEVPAGYRPVMLQGGEE